MRAVVDEVMRSCGGAVQGVRVDDGPLLNRQDDGFCFFDCGSWTQGPTKLTDGALNLDVGLVAQSGSRVRCTASVSARHVVDATVVVEERAWTRAASQNAIARGHGLAVARTAPQVDAVDRGNDPAGRRRASAPAACLSPRVDNNGATDVVVRADDVSRADALLRRVGALVAISLHAPSPQDGAD